MITVARVKKCLATIETIVSSPAVDQYLIGFTGLSAQEKGDQYRRKGIDFEHLVILADKLDCTDALTLERKLQQRTLLGDESIVVTQKYHAEKKARGSLHASDGGTSRDKSIKDFSVYIAWWTV